MCHTAVLMSFRQQLKLPSLKVTHRSPSVNATFHVVKRGAVGSGPIKSIDTTPNCDFQVQIPLTSWSPWIMILKLPSFLTQNCKTWLSLKIYIVKILKSAYIQSSSGPQWPRGIQLEMSFCNVLSKVSLCPISSFVWSAHLWLMQDVSNVVHICITVPSVVSLLTRKLTFSILLNCGRFAYKTIL